MFDQSLNYNSVFSPLKITEKSPPQKVFMGARFDMRPAQTGKRSGSHSHWANSGGMGVIITGRWRSGVTLPSRGGPALIMWTEGSSHQGVNWETLAICPQRLHVGTQCAQLSLMYQPTPGRAPILLMCLRETSERLWKALHVAGKHV